MIFHQINTHSVSGHEKCEKLHSFGPAIRGYYLMHFVIGGKGTFMTDEGDFHLGAGEGFLISPGEVTTYIADGEDPWEYFWVGIADTEQTRETLKRHGLDRTTHRFTYQDNTGLLPYLISVKEGSQVVLEPDWSTGVFHCLMSTLPIPKSVQSPSNTYVDQCYHYMEAHFFETLTVDLLSQYLNVSRSHLYRIFRSALGISPQQAILNFRLDKAAELIKRGDISLTQIAHSCGFCDLSHFSKAYKARFGTCPLQVKPKKE